MQRRTVLSALAGLSLGGGARAQSGFDATPWPSGLPLPPLSAPDLAGRPWNLAQLQGRAVLLNFWATWCEPCRAELPGMQALADLHGPDRLAVLCVNAKESAEKVGRFVLATGLRLPVLLDPDGRTTQAWGVRVFPTTVLIAADGKARWRIRGEVDWSGSAAEKLLAPLLPPEGSALRRGSSA
jgi:thiol-disulfide isomerase/thioredoxin